MLRHHLGVLFAVSAPALAQQFLESPGLFPGTARWSEGVELLDIDHDGDLDVIFAEGDGFASPGAQRQNRLYRNTLIETGSLSFVDESVLRFGANTSNGKGLAIGDVDGDGWEDILFANGFNTTTPYLYINQGPAQPGFFVEESSSRGLTEILSSAGAQFGDVDDDGDLDIVITDSGSSFLGGAGAAPLLYRNDGSGNFSEDLSFSPATKVAQMDVQFEDVDLDWDIDCFISCRANNGAQDHYLLLNDGSGSFTDVSSAIPGTSNLVYEAEVADLDGDLDHDLFFTSLQGFNEGHMTNQLVETGTLDFVSGVPQTQGTDDNEIAFIDWDNDDDYDIIVGSLGANERAYRNNAAMTFTYNQNRIEKIADSTLDVAIGDIDNNGTYDLVTAQGESGNFTNRGYLNTGDPDQNPPRVMETNIPSGFGSGFVVHARVRDQVRDDGVDYITGSAYTGPLPDAIWGITYQGGAFSPNSQTVDSGSLVAFDNLDGAAITISTTSAPFEWSLDVAGNSSGQRSFVTPGVYTIESSAGGTLTLTVTSNFAIAASATRLGGEIHRMAFENLGFGPVFAVEMIFTDYQGNQVFVDGIDVPRGAGTNYCTAELNSTGQAATIYATGSVIANDNNFAVTAVSLPTNQFGYFITSQSQGFIPLPPGSQGNICLGPPFIRFVSLVQNSGATGAISTSLDLSFFPLPYGAAVVGGQTWNFQAWYRDNNGGSTSNFTDGVSVMFL